MNVLKYIDLYCIIGYPIDHSLSPVIYNYLFKIMGLEAYYFKYPLRSMELEIGLTFLKEKDIKGFNVTMPLKGSIVRFLSKVSADAKQIGAVNTVKNISGKYYGYNTDWIGVLRSIENVVRNVNLESCLIIGAGGAGKSAVYALKKICKLIYIANRNFYKAKAVASKMSMNHVKIFPILLNERSIRSIIHKVDIVINATPVGMDGKGMIIPEEMLNHDTIYFDMVYKPINTPLIKAAKEVGAKTIDGLWMLIFQAIEAFKIWINMNVSGILAQDIRRTLEAGIYGM